MAARDQTPLPTSHSADATRLGLSGPLGGGSLVERNLNRWTIGFAIAFAVNTVLLIKKPWK